MGSGFRDTGLRGTWGDPGEQGWRGEAMRYGAGLSEADQAAADERLSRWYEEGLEEGDMFDESLYMASDNVAVPTLGIPRDPSGRAARRAAHRAGPSAGTASVPSVMFGAEPDEGASTEDILAFLEGLHDPTYGG